jgi:hypothetical protein
MLPSQVLKMSARDVVGKYLRHDLSLNQLFPPFLAIISERDKLNYFMQIWVPRRRRLLRRQIEKGKGERPCTVPDDHRAEKSAHSPLCMQARYCERHRLPSITEMLDTPPIDQKNTWPSVLSGSKLQVDKEKGSAKDEHLYPWGNLQDKRVRTDVPTT